MASSERLASIKFGNTRFYLNISDSVKDFLNEKNVDSQKIIPTAPSWYNLILENLGFSHQNEKEIEVLFFSIKDEGGFREGKEKPPEEYSVSFESPLRFEGQNGEREETRIKFFCKVSK